MPNAVITGVSGFVPDFVLSNDVLSAMVDTNDAWIQERTGILERRILVEKGKGSSDMATEAIRSLFLKKKIDPSEIDLIICATTTPDHVFPATANIIADKVGIKNAFGFDIQAACSGFLYALVTASKYIQSGSHKKVLVVGVDKMSSIIDYTDRATSIIFGDGAGVVLLEPTEESLGIIDSKLYSDGVGRTHLHQKAGGSVLSPNKHTIDQRLHYVYQEGSAVFKWAVAKMADVSEEIMHRNHLKSEDIAWLVPHQANKRIIDATARRAGLPDEKVMLNIHKFGNTTSGTIPLCLWEWESKLKKGDNLILCAFGGGFTWGAVYLKWGY
jgi:3-oxoacyl-[acyl-carrier-protein] synthase-3